MNNISEALIPELRKIETDFHLALIELIRIPSVINETERDTRGHLCQSDG